MTPKLAFDIIPGGCTFSLSALLPGHDELSPHVLNAAATLLEETAELLRDAVAGKAMASNAKTGKLLFVPPALRSSVADMLSTIGKKTGGDV